MWSEAEKSWSWEYWKCSPDLSSTSKLSGSRKASPGLASCERNRIKEVVVEAWAVSFGKNQEFANRKRRPGEAESEVASWKWKLRNQIESH